MAASARARGTTKRSESGMVLQDPLAPQQSLRRLSESAVAPSRLSLHGVAFKGMLRELRRQRLRRLQAELSDALDLPHEIVLAGGELAVGVVVARLGGLQAPADVLQIRDEADELVVEGGALAHQLLGVAVLVLVAPDARDRAQRDEERGQIGRAHV